jgi:hypothetical protein
MSTSETFKRMIESRLISYGCRSLFRYDSLTARSVLPSPHPHRRGCDELGCGWGGGQVLGSIAVFVTLGYLAVQVRYARSETRRALSQSRGDGYRAMLQFECDERITSIEMRLRSALLKEGDPPNPWGALSEQTGVPVEEIKVLFYKEYGWWLYRVGIMSHADDLPVMKRFMFDTAVRAAYGNPGPSRFILSH